MRGWKKIFHANGNQKKSGVAILISDKTDIKIKTITRDKEGHYIMIKGSIQEEDRTIVNIYAPTIGAPQYIRQMLTAIKGEIDSNTVIVGDFNTPLLPMDRSSKMKINKETQDLNDSLDKMDLIDIARTFHPQTTEYTFFSSDHGTFSRIDHTLGHKSSLGKFKKIEGFPGGAVVENLPANAGDTGSSPGLGSSHMPRSNWAREPQLLSLRVWSPCSATREAAIMRGPRTAMKSGPHLPQLEKALTQKRRPDTAINK